MFHHWGGENCFVCQSEKRSLFLENLRGGDKNILADSGFKDPVVLRVRKRPMFGKYPLYQSVANVYLLLAISFPFFDRKTYRLHGRKYNNFSIVIS